MKTYYLAFLLVAFSITRIFAGAENTNAVRTTFHDALLILKVAANEGGPLSSKNLTLNLQVTNVSTNLLIVAEEDPKKDYLFIITLPSGKEVIFSNDKEIGGHSGVRQTKLKPSENWSSSFNFSTYFELKESGKYRMTAKRFVYNFTEKKRFEITSNPIQFELK